MSEFLSPDGYRTSAELATALLNDAHVALTPGEAFDAPGFLRISYATSMKELERGSQRILEFLASSRGRSCRFRSEFVDALRADRRRGARPHATTPRGVATAPTR